MSLFQPHSPTLHDIWQPSPSLGTDLSHAPYSPSVQAPSGKAPVTVLWCPELFMLLPATADMLGWGEHGPALTWTKHLADPSCTFPTRMGLDQTTAALLLGSHDILINGWLQKTLNGMKGGPGYPKMEVGHATFNEIIMNIPRTILPIRRNPSLTIYLTAFTFLENATAVRNWCFL